jgi:hypothetical protein
MKGRKCLDPPTDCQLPKRDPVELVKSVAGALDTNLNPETLSLLFWNEILRGLLKLALMPSMHCLTL